MFLPLVKLRAQSNKQKVSRREERHISAPRFESEMAVSHVEEFGKGRSPGKHLYQCPICQHLFNERSLRCPRGCKDEYGAAKVMGELKPIRESRIKEYNDQSIRRIRRGLSITPP